MTSQQNAFQANLIAAKKAEMESSDRQLAQYETRRSNEAREAETRRTNLAQEKQRAIDSKRNFIGNLVNAGTSLITGGLRGTGSLLSGISSVGKGGSGQQIQRTNTNYNYNYHYKGEE